MTPGERVEYFTKLWPAACRANGWQPKDDDRRRQIALRCMREVRGPLVTTSDALFGRDEVTALFCFLNHLAHPGDFNRSAEWDTCKQDYRTYNRARQADWHERKLYGARKNKLDRNRFAGAKTASGGPLDDLDPAAVRKRHVTFASRHQRKMRAEKKGQKMASTPVPAAFVPGHGVPPPGSVILLPPPADLEPAFSEPDPAYHPPVDQPF